MNMSLNILILVFQRSKLFWHFVSEKAKLNNGKWLNFFLIFRILRTALICNKDTINNR